MKDFWNKFYGSRVGQYLIYGFIYFAFAKVLGTPLTILLLLITIVGELHYQDMHRK